VIIRELCVDFVWWEIWCGGVEVGVRDLGFARVWGLEGGKVSQSVRQDVKDV